MSNAQKIYANALASCTHEKDGNRDECMESYGIVSQSNRCGQKHAHPLCVDGDDRPRFACMNDATTTDKCAPVAGTLNAHVTRVLPE